MFLTLASFAPRNGGMVLLAASCFAAGMAAGALIGPSDAGRRVEPAATEAMPERAPPTAGIALRSGHPAEVLRVFDGDTFEARVRIWPGMDVTTKVRLRNVDAPEMHARCEDERVKAIAARDALAQMLAEGGVGVSRIGQDKYGGRVDADVSSVRTADIGEALIARGLARRYTGGRRESWCG